MFSFVATAFSASLEVAFATSITICLSGEGHNPKVSKCFLVDILFIKEATIAALFLGVCGKVSFTLSLARFHVALLGKLVDYCLRCRYSFLLSDIFSLFLHNTFATFFPILSFFS